MKNPIPEAARIDVPQDQMTTVHFVTKMVEQIMMITGAVTAKAGQRGNYHTIEIGKLAFKAPTEREVFRQLFYYLVVTEPKSTPEELLEAANQVLQMEAADTEEMLNLLAEGGMTDFGQRVQLYRLERGGKLAQALKEIEEERTVIPRDVNLLINILAAKTKYEDIGADEVIVALADMRRLKEQFDPVTARSRT